MYKCCAVFSCANSTSRSKNSMYKFPTDPTICEKWVEFCKSDKINDMLVLEGVDKLRNSSFYVCSDHFEKRCFVNPRNTSQGIYKGSIPTIIAGHPVLVSNFKKANQIPDFYDLDAHHRRSPESREEEMTVEVLLEELEEAIPAEPVISTKVETAAAQPEALPVATRHSMLHSPSFACQECPGDYEYRAKFFEERTRALDLVKEIKATTSKLRAARKPIRRKNAWLKRINASIRTVKEKIRALAEEYHTVVELSSESDDEG